EREAEARSPEATARGQLGLRELLEEPAELLLRHPDARVTHVEDEDARAPARLPTDAERDDPALGELARVGQQVEERLAYLGEVGPHLANGGGRAHPPPGTLLVRARLGHPGRPAPAGRAPGHPPRE